MKVVAKQPIIYRGRQYEKGEPISNADPEIIEIWIENDVVHIPGGEKLPKKAKAKAETAPAPPGKKENGIGAEGSMIGMPPDRNEK